MEHTHRDSSYRFCRAGDNRSRATAETGRKTGRSAGGARGPRPCSSRGARASPGACTSRGRRSSPGACASRRGAARVGAARRAAAPHVSAQRAAPRQVARPSGGPPASAMARHAPTPQTSAAPTQQQPQTAGRGGRGGARLAQPTQPSPRTNAARPSPTPGAAATVGAAAAGAAAAAHIGRTGTPQQNVTPQAQANRSPQTAASPHALAGGVLRNQAFANLSAARDPNARMLAHSTFQGRFFDPQWRRRFAHPIVFGWVGPLFWPYAYDDFVD